MLSRHFVRLAVISILLFSQGVFPGFSAQVQTYDELLAAIRQTRTESRTRVEQAVAREKVREAWETGKLINEHILLHQERAEYGKQVIVKLAKDLGTSETELYRMLEFSRIYPILAPAQELSWSQYREIIYVKDAKERERVVKESSSKHWSKNELRREIKKLRSEDVAASPAEVPLEAKAGKVGTYRVLKATVGEYKGQRVLDLGFSNFINLSSVSRDIFTEGDIVTLEKGILQRSQAGPEALFTYRADVVAVIDGDTFKAAISLGFGFTSVQKLRLRGLDAPEIESADGQEAKAFLEKQLANAKTSLILRTVKSDKYDRYLADVWAEGRYVNQALIEEGLAVRVEE